MLQNKLTYLIVISLFFLLGSCNSITTKSNGSSGVFDKKAKELLSNMSLEEKVGQMTQITINMFFDGKFYKPNRPLSLNEDSIQKYLVDLKCGSVFGAPRFPLTRKQWHQFITILQDKSIETTGIPLIYGIDAVHGVNFTLESTLFPQQIGMAATWNPDIVKRIGEITAYETKASSATWNFSPVLGLARQPLWSRFEETFGEDVYLTSEMGKAIIEGFEGDDISNPEKVAACMKHYVGYSVPLSGKDRTQAWIPERILREYFLVPFREASKIGVHSLMINSGEVNGIPVHCDKYLLTDVLRNELGFDGIAVTDFKDIKLLHTSHKVARDYKEAIKLAINAGVDMSMVPFDTKFTQYLIELVNEGEVPMSRINESVIRILKVKLQSGLFEKAVPEYDYYTKFGSDEFKSVALNAALESITLLKNSNNILPLSKDIKILVTGPTANKMIYLNGSWSYTWQGADPSFDWEIKNTVFEAIKNLNPNTKFVHGTELETEINIDEVIQAAKLSDVVIACVGELPGVEEKGNTNTLELSEIQEKLVKEISKTGKPIILVLNTARPRIITEIAELADAIIMPYQPGNEGGDALAKLIFGDENFSGKLPFTYPKYAASISTYDHKYTDHNIDTDIKGYNPLFEFGFGLSYTNFEYTDLKISNKSFAFTDSILISVNVSNKGKMAGKEVVQLFIADQYASITPCDKRLRGFEKIELLPHQSKTVNFNIPVSDLAFVDADNNWIVEPGDFTVEIGNLSDTFMVTK